MLRVYYSFAILLILISFVYCDDVTPQNPLESQVLLLLEKWRVGPVDSVIIPLPSLSSIKVPDVEYSYDQKGIKMTYMFKKMVLTGLNNFIIKKLVVSETNNSVDLLISLNMPKLTLYAENYKLQGRAYLLYSFKGSGNMTIIFLDNDLTFKFRIMSIKNGTSTDMEDFQFNFNVHQIQLKELFLNTAQALLGPKIINLNGVRFNSQVLILKSIVPQDITINSTDYGYGRCANLTNSSWPVNKVLNSEGVEILASYHDDIVQATQNYVVPYADKLLVNISIPQILDWIMDTNL